MKVKIKYTGAGLESKGIYFTADKNDGLYDVEKDVADYLLNTFPDHFIMIERAVKEEPTKEVEAPAEKKKPAPKKRQPKKTTSTPKKEG